SLLDCVSSVCLLLRRSLVCVGTRARGIPCLCFFHRPAPHPDLHSFPTRRSSDLAASSPGSARKFGGSWNRTGPSLPPSRVARDRSEEHTSELQSRVDLVCRLLLEKKKKQKTKTSRESTTTTKRRPTKHRQTSPLL